MSVVISVAALRILLASSRASCKGHGLKPRLISSMIQGSDCRRGVFFCFSFWRSTSGRKVTGHNTPSFWVPVSLVIGFGSQRLFG